MYEDLYGQDIKLDDALQAAIAANGEAILADGVATVLQDIRLRLVTPLGTLFYDTAFGSLVYEYVKDENTPANRRGLAAEVAKRIDLDARVVPGSARCTIAAWDETGITLTATFRLIGETHPYNLVITVDSDMEMVMNDVSTGQ